MISWAKKIWNSHITITICRTTINIYDGIEHTTTPREIFRTAPPKMTGAKSNYRFVSNEKTTQDGTVTKYWFTERKVGKHWVFVDRSLSSTHTEAMSLHLDIVKKQQFIPTEIKTVEWEGLAPAETETWITLSTSNIN